MRTARMITVVSIAVLAIGLAFEGRAADPARRPQIKNYEAPGNLESKYDLGCVGAEKLESKYTPTDLYTAFSRCIEAGKYREGTFLFALAGVYGRFDTFRVADKTAHQAVAVARMQALGGVDKDKQTAFQDNLNKTLGDPEDLTAVCKDIRRIGPPSYFPRYMIQHGMGAFLKSGPADGLVKNFDAKAAWKRALDTYLHCPGL